MKQTFIAIVGIFFFCCCTNNKVSNLDKMLFLLNRNNAVLDYPYFRMKDMHCNVDSFLDAMDIDIYKVDETEGKRGVKRAIMLCDGAWLDSICNDEQLIQLVSDKKNAPAVKVTAFAALVRRKYKGIEKMVLDNYKDTATLTVWHYDFGWSEHVGSIFLRYADMGNISSDDSIKNISLALFTPDIPVYEYLLSKTEEMQPVDEKHYQRFHELYAKKTDEHLLKAIAMYRNPKDLEFIAHELKDYQKDGKENEHVVSALEAISEWPHDYFKSQISELCNDIQKGRIVKLFRVPDRLVKAIMAYDKSWAHPFLDKILKEDSKTRKKLLIDAFHFEMIRIDNNPDYNDLLKKYPSEQLTNN